MNVIPFFSSTGFNPSQTKLVIAPPVVSPAKALWHSSQLLSGVWCYTKQNPTPPTLHAIHRVIDVHRRLALRIGDREEITVGVIPELGHAVDDIGELGDPVEGVGGMQIELFSDPNSTLGLLKNWIFCGN